MPRFAKTTASVATTKMCAYEKERLANIARNRERMAALGVLDAARDIAHAAHAERLAEREKRAALTTAATASGRQIARALGGSAARGHQAQRSPGGPAPPRNKRCVSTTRDGLDHLGEACGRRDGIPPRTARRLARRRRPGLCSWTATTKAAPASTTKARRAGRATSAARRRCASTRRAARAARREGSFAATACSCGTAKTWTRRRGTRRAVPFRAATCATAASAGRRRGGLPPARCTGAPSKRDSSRSRTTSCSAATRAPAKTQTQTRPKAPRRRVRVRARRCSGSLGKDDRAEHAFKKAPRSSPPVPPVSGKTRSVNALHAPAPETPGRRDASRARKRLRREA